MPPSRSRRTQRAVTTCTECARRKIRCSKTVPCTSCVRKHIGEHCHREAVRVVTKNTAVAVGMSSAIGGQTPEASPSAIELEDFEEDPRRITRDHTMGHPENAFLCPQAPTGVASQADEGASYLAATPSVRLTNDKAASLEFLAYGRRGILNHLGGLEASSSYSGSRNHGVDEAGTEQFMRDRTLVEWDVIYPLQEARALLSLHERHISWMHNVVHMPSFMEQFEVNVASGLCQKPWLALYYAIMTSTLYHIPEPELEALGSGIIVQLDTVEEVYTKSIDYLYRSEFISKHDLASIQAICVLLQVAHHYDQSDTICVLVAAAIRIAQCLNIHRLGPDSSVQMSSTFRNSSPAQLIEREVKKRVWWFLVRQDWLQIPFQNTCLIHVAQFNTPMPINCFESRDEMIKNGTVIAQADNVFTQTSYTHTLNQVAVIIWKHQNRLCQVGFPGDVQDALLDLYDQTTWADRELKQIYSNCAPFLQFTPFPPSQQAQTNEATNTLKHLACVALLSTAHKIFTVHRHFQLRSFRDTRFAYTQLSCMSLAERSIRMIEQWGNALDFQIAKRMWTTPTHVITCCITILFALMFRFQHPLTYDYEKLRECVKVGRDFIREVEPRSSIARRGARLLDALMAFDYASANSRDIELEIGDVIRRVAIAETSAEFVGGVSSRREDGKGAPDISELWDQFIGETDLRVYEGSF